MFQREGYAVERIVGIRPYFSFPNASKRLWTAYRLANALFSGKFTDMKFLQFAVVAKPGPTVY
jgi:hypothetical protein